MVEAGLQYGRETRNTCFVAPVLKAGELAEQLKVIECGLQDPRHERGRERENNWQEERGCLIMVNESETELEILCADTEKPVDAVSSKSRQRR